MAEEATGGAVDYSLAFIAKMDLSQLQADFENIQNMIRSLSEATAGNVLEMRFKSQGLTDIINEANSLSSRTVDITTVTDGTALAGLNSDLNTVSDKKVNIDIAATGDAELRQKIESLMQVVNQLKAEIDSLKSTVIDPQINKAPFIAFEVAVEAAKEKVQELKEATAEPITPKINTSELLQGEALAERLQIILGQEESQLHTIHLNGGDITAAEEKVAILRSALINLGKPVQIGLPALPEEGLNLGGSNLNPAETEAATEAYNKLNQTVAQLTSTFRNMGLAASESGHELSASAQEEVGIIQTLINTQRQLNASRNEATGLEELKEYNASLQLTEAELTQMRNIGKDGFDEIGNKIVSATNSLKDLGLAGVTSIEQIIEANDGAAASIQQLIALQQELTSQRNATTDPYERASLNGQISDVGQAKSNAQNAGTDGYDLVGNKVEQVTAAIQRMRDAGVRSVADIIEANDGEMYSMEQLIELQRNLSALRSESTDIAQIAEYNAAIGEATVAMGQLKNVGTSGFDSFGNKVSASTSALEKLGLVGVTSVKDIVAQNDGLMASLEQLLALQKELNDLRAGSSDIGQVNSLNKEIQTTENAIGQLQNAGKDGFDSMGEKVGGISAAIGKLGSTITSVLPYMAVFFAIQKVLDFGSEIIKLIPLVDGVGNAFLAAGGSTSGIQQLRASTRGLISDLDLEKAAVKFSDFNLPASQLGVILGEVAKQAQDLGLNIDEKIGVAVQALGTNGNRALASLGVSTAEFTAKLAEGKTRAEALTELLQTKGELGGVTIETLGDRFTQMGVNIDNAKKGLAEFFEALFTGSKGAPLDQITAYIDNIQSHLGDVTKRNPEELQFQLGYLQQKTPGLAKAAQDAQDAAGTFRPTVDITSDIVQLAALHNADKRAQDANAALKANSDYIESIKKQLDLQQKQVENISLLQQQRDLFYKQAQDQNLNAPGGPQKSLDYKAQGDKINDRINVLDGTDAEKAAAAALALQKQQQREIQNDAKKAGEDLQSIYLKIGDTQKDLSAAAATPLEAAIQTAKDQLAEIIREINDAVATRAKAGLSSPGAARAIQNAKDNETQQEYGAEYNSNIKDAVKDGKEADKTQDKTFGNEMELRKKQYSDELQYEKTYGQQAAQDQFGYSTTATNAYLSYLESKSDELTYNMAFYPDANRKADQDEIDKITQDVLVLKQSATDATQNLGASLLSSNQTVADKIVGIQAKLKRDLAAINDPSVAGTPEQKSFASQTVTSKSNADAANVESDAMIQDRKAAGEVAPVLVSLGASFSTLGDAIGKTNKGLGDMISYVGGALSEIGGLAQAFAQGGPIGALLKGISDLAGAVASVFTSQAKAAADLLAYQQKANQLAVEYALTLQGIADKQALTDQTHIASLQAGLALLKSQSSTNNDSLTTLYDQLRQGTIVTGETTQHNFFGKAYNRDVQESASGLSNADLDKAAALGQLTGSQLVTWNKINAIKQANLAIDTQTAQQQTAYNNALVGQTAESVDSALMTGMSSAAGATSVITDALRKSVLAGLDAAYIKPIADKLFNDIAADSDANFKATGNSTLTTAQINTLTTKYSDTLKTAYTNVNTLVNSLTGPSVASTSNMSQAISGITSSQADLLAGQFGGLRLTAVAQLSIQTAILSELQKMAGDPQTATNLLLATTANATSVATPDTAASTALMQGQLAALIAIQTNTANTDKNTAPINATLQVIYRDMVKSGQASQQLNQNFRATGRPATR